MNSGSHAKRPLMFFRNLIREPLVHFLVIGSLFFAADAYRGLSDGEPKDNWITISQSDIESIAKRHVKQMGKLPTAQELSSLIDAQIREEVFYREALAMGLDRDDTIIRRRLAQKLEFLSPGMLMPEAPEEESVLAAYYQKNIERYRQQERARFTQLYFSEDKRDGKAQAGALSARNTLNSRVGAQLNAAEMGDLSPIRLEDEFYTPDQLTRLFGRPFSESLFGLENNADSWRGPIQSGYGWHLVRISGHEDSLLPELADVRERVLNDWSYETRKIANNRYYEILKTGYRINIEGVSENPQ